MDVVAGVVVVVWRSGGFGSLRKCVNVVIVILYKCGRLCHYVGVITCVDVVDYVNVVNLWTW